MVGFVSVILILASILLIIVVFVQNSKGGGLSSDFGSAQQLGGVQRSTEFIEKATWVLAAVIMLGSLTLTSLMKPEQIKVEQPTEQQNGQPGNTPSSPAQPGQ